MFCLNIIAENDRPSDMIFIAEDKTLYTEYFTMPLTFSQAHLLFLIMLSGKGKFLLRILVIKKLKKCSVLIKY